MLGKFEENTLLSLIRSGPNSTPADVYEELAKHLNNLPSFGALFTCLNRMEKKKWVKVELVSERAGQKPRKRYTINGAGRIALNESLQTTRSLTGGQFGPIPVGGKL